MKPTTQHPSTVLQPLRPLIIWATDKIPNRFISDEAAKKFGNRARRLRAMTQHAAIQYGSTLSRNALNTRVVRRVEWVAGRSFRDEEKRAGAVVYVNSSEDNSTRPVCLAKVLPSDLLINEVMDDGEVIVLSDRPRADWKKTYSGDRLFLERDTEVPTSDPEKTYRKLFTNFGHYLLRAGRVPHDTDHLWFQVYREDCTLHDAFNRVEYTTGLRNARGAAWDCASPDLLDSHSCTTQMCSALAMTKEMLPAASRRYALYPTFVNPLRYASRHIKPSDARGARHTMLLRRVHVDSPAQIDDIFQRIAEHGFLNYYPMTCFGAAGCGWHEIGLALLKGRHDEAMRGLLQTEAESHPVVYDGYLRYLASNTNTSSSSSSSPFRSWIETLQAWNDTKNMRRVLKALDSNMPYSDVFAKRIPAEQRQRYYRAVQCLAWNMHLSNRVATHGLHVVEGDVVCIVDDRTTDGKHLRAFDPTASRQFHVVGKGEESQFNFSQVVIPVPGREAAAAASNPFFSQFLQRAGITSEQWLNCEDLPSHNTFRFALCIPERLQWQVVEDPFSHTVLKSDLALLQERFSAGVRNATLLDRIRDPCRHNVSPRFDVTMQQDCPYPNGKYSVTFSCNLPRGAHVSMLLREAFDVKYKRFNDLMAARS
eukprot:PhM_4_TR5358/c0_g1_i1/m.88416/K06176/truD, PUS7; tRNA pseudouridine13 synthase